MTTDAAYPMTDYPPAASHPPHRFVLSGREQQLYMQLYPPGHVYNSPVNLGGKLVLVGKRLGTQQRVHIEAENIDKLIEALQYAKAKLLKGET